MTPNKEAAQSERERFKAWAMRVGKGFRYCSSMNEIELTAAWQAWQARAAVAPPVAEQPQDELERLRSALTLLPEDEASFPDGFDVVVLRTERYWQLRAAEEGEPVAAPAQAWEPKFEAMASEQERLAIQFCAEIAGRHPDAVRLIEMAEALYLAERNDPHFGVAAPLSPQAAQTMTEQEIIDLFDGIPNNPLNGISEAFKPVMIAFTRAIEARGKR